MVSETNENKERKNKNNNNNNNNNNKTFRLLLPCLNLFYMNTFGVSPLEMSPKHFTMATIALFSASEQSHCAVVVLHSE